MGSQSNEKIKQNTNSFLSSPVEISQIIKGIFWTIIIGTIATTCSSLLLNWQESSLARYNKELELLDEIVSRRTYGAEDRLSLLHQLKFYNDLQVFKKIDTEGLENDNLDDLIYQHINTIVATVKINDLIATVLTINTNDSSSLEQENLNLIKNKLKMVINNVNLVRENVPHYPNIDELVTTLSSIDLENLDSKNVKDLQDNLENWQNLYADRLFFSELSWTDSLEPNTI